jgi:hypothetical protein
VSARKVMEEEVVVVVVLMVVWGWCIRGE